LSLLQDIIEQATSSETPLADVLRRCKTLAFRLDYEPLADWVDKELDGYANEDEVPDYRTIPVSVTGRFSGFAVGHWMTTEAEIGRTRLPEEMTEAEDHLFTHSFTQGVAGLEDLLSSPDGSFKAPWTPEAAGMMTNKVLQNFQCEAAWRVIPRGAIAGLLDTIRNRILSFALAIERASPEAGDVPADGPPALARDEVSRIADITIYGGHNVFAVGGQKATVRDVRITADDWEALREALDGLGFHPDDLEALPEVLANDDAVEGELGPKTKRWLTGALGRLRSGASAVAPEIAGGTAAGLILQYLGVG
jgi:hypothetical protein